MRSGTPESSSSFFRRNFLKTSLAVGTGGVGALLHAAEASAGKLQCNIYHMLKENEPPEEIIKYKKHLVHRPIAEKQHRTAARWKTSSRKWRWGLPR